MDLYYIRHRDLWLDFKLLLLTIPAVLSCRRAYHVRTPGLNS